MWWILYCFFNKSIIYRNTKIPPNALVEFCLCFYFSFSSFLGLSLASFFSSKVVKDFLSFSKNIIFENGMLLMVYENLENLIENRSIFLVCDGTKIMVLRKTDMVIGNPEEFGLFIEDKTKKKTYLCN